MNLYDMEFLQIKQTKLPILQWLDYFTRDRTTQQLHHYPCKGKKKKVQQKQQIDASKVYLKTLFSDNKYVKKGKKNLIWKKPGACSSTDNN